MTKLKNRFVYVFLTITSIVSVFPLYWMACAATNKSVDVLRGKLIPGTYLMQNLENLLANQNVQAAFVNSFKYATILTLISLVVCSLAGYAFEIYHDKAKDFVMDILLLAMMIPFAATMIPLFQMFSKANLLNCTLGFILPTISKPFLIMMFRQGARSFPHELIDAARLDGVSEVGIFARIFFPSMRSTYAAAMTITFMNAWNNYLWPKIIMLDNNSITMPMVVANLCDTYATDYGMLMLAVFICTIPTVIIFFLLQKSFANGITGSIK